MGIIKLYLGVKVFTLNFYYSDISFRYCLKFSWCRVLTHGTAVPKGIFIQAYVVYWSHSAMAPCPPLIMSPLYFHVFQRRTFLSHQCDRESDISADTTLWFQEWLRRLVLKLNLGFQQGDHTDLIIMLVFLSILYFSKHFVCVVNSPQSEARSWVFI